MTRTAAGEVRFHADDLVLTDRELRLPGTSYPLAQIDGASTVREPAAASGPVMMIVAGLVCLLAAVGEVGFLGVALSVVLIGAAVVWWTRKRPTFQLRVRTPSEETVVFESRDEERVRQAADALAAALASREGETS